MHHPRRRRYTVTCSCVNKHQLVAEVAANSNQGAAASGNSKSSRHDKAARNRSGGAGTRAGAHRGTPPGSREGAGCSRHATAGMGVHRRQGHAGACADAMLRPWRPQRAQATYGDGSTGQNRGIEGGTHSEHEGEVGEAGGGPERRQSTPDAGDVRVEDEVDGERTGRPSSNRCSGKMKLRVEVLLDNSRSAGELIGRGNNNDDQEAPILADCIAFLFVTHESGTTIFAQVTLKCVILSLNC